MVTKTKIEQVRKKIDKIDDQILELIQKRGVHAKEIGGLKSQLSAKSSFYKPEREAQILRRLIEKNSGLISDKKVKSIFKELISACLSLEESLQIAFLGPLGTHSEAAVKKHFGSSINLDPRATIDDVFYQVTNGTSQFGMVPFENSSEGVVNATLNCLVDEKLLICGETYLDIEHNLAGRATSKISTAKVIASHPQALGQCSKWLENNLPNIKRKLTSSTAKAAELAKSNKDTLCIVGSLAVEKYKLKMHAQNIENHSDNRTRFLIVGNQKISKTGKDKTSLLIQTNNKPGALVKLLKPFEEKKINLFRVETRPSRSTRDSHNFFIDSAGHQSDSKLQKVISTIRSDGAFVRILGSYPDES